MRSTTLLLALPVVAAPLLPASAAAQERAGRFDAAAMADSAASDAVQRRPRGIRFLSVTKWATLAAAAGSAAYGFATSHRADEDYEALERYCADAANREQCSNRTPDGAFEDTELEARYQDIVTLDDRARLALVASQVGVAASVLMFILDLREDRAPPNIPYEPRRLRVGRAEAGGVELRVTLPTGGPPGGGGR